MEENLEIFESFIVIGMDCEWHEMKIGNLKKIDYDDIGVLNFLSKKNEYGDFLDNLKFWCFPNGIQIFDEFLSDIKFLDTQRAPASFSSIEDYEIIEQFVITDEKCVKRYCSSLLFFEKKYVKNDSFADAKKNKDISKISIFMPKVSLKTLINNPICHKNTGYQLVYVPKALCIISQMPFFETEIQFLELIYKRILLPRRDPRKHPFRRFRISEEGQKIKETKLFDFYITSLFSLFTLSEKDSNIAFMDLDCRTPQKLMTFKTNNTIGLNVPTYNFHLLFERLSLSNILLVFSAILQEKQIVIFGSNSRELTNICETLLSLITPLTWGCIYIPFLPLELWEMLSAMMPFIIGIDDQYREILTQKMKLNDQIIVDLVRDKVENCQELIEIPMGIRRFLSGRLEEIVGREKSLGNILRIKQIFLYSMYLILNNIGDFFIPRNSSNTKNPISSEIFNFKDFLDSFRNGNEDAASFAENLGMNTMMFNKFIEDCFKVGASNKEAQVEEDNWYFLKEIKKLVRSSFNSNGLILNIDKNPTLFSELQQEQDVEISHLISRFDLSPPEEKSLLPYYSKFCSKCDSIKTPKSRSTLPNNHEKHSFFSKLNKSLEIIPIFSNEIRLIKPPIDKKNIHLTAISTRKKILQRLASYEISGGKEGHSPTSKLISKIKSFYFYYHAVKRNITYNNFRRLTDKRYKSNELGGDEHREDLKQSEKKERLTPFFQEIPLANDSSFDNNLVNGQLFNQTEELLLFSHKKATLACSNQQSIQDKPRTGNLVNPQDSSCELTPNINLKKEPASFSQWLFDNSKKRADQWVKIKEDMREKEILVKMGTRSLSPKKRRKNN